MKLIVRFGEEYNDDNEELPSFWRVWDIITVYLWNDMLSLRRASRSKRRKFKNRSAWTKGTSCNRAKKEEENKENKEEILTRVGTN
jgi:hypothetical protein